jgi:flagellar motility protein MotE (MotC chaperone)
MDWQVVLSIGALLIAGISFLVRSFDKSLSIREHEEFRNAVRAEMDRMRVGLQQSVDQSRRDDDRLEDRIKVLEATRPTTGELEAKLGRGTSGL